MGRRLGGIVLVVALLAGARVATQSGAAAGVVYRPPVDAPLVDRFRPPSSPFGPGNRGIDYATAPGTPVRAAAAGQVIFAGQVGGHLHVVVLHGDGVRTSYSFLAAVTVRRGDRVEGGQPVGRSGSALHFGARRGEEYIDPLTLLGPVPRGRFRLVPDSTSEASVPGDERAEALGVGRAQGPQPIGPAALRWAMRCESPARSRPCPRLR